MKSFMFIIAGNPYAYGPIKAPNLKVAAKKVRLDWGVKRLGFDYNIWESDGLIK